LFEYLSKHKRIVVTGPQRSGTRIGAKMISYDLGYNLIDEREIDIDSLYRLNDMIRLDKVVIQAPALCRFAHFFGVAQDTAVVLMVRDIDDIIASQERINWTYESIEMVYYADLIEGGLLEAGPIAAVKYQGWELQKAGIPHWYEIEYKSLKGHPLWIDKIERKSFAPHQTNLHGTLKNSTGQATLDAITSGITGEF